MRTKLCRVLTGQAPKKRANIGESSLRHREALRCCRVGEPRQSSYDEYEQCISREPVNVEVVSGPAAQFKLCVARAELKARKQHVEAVPESRGFAIAPRRVLKPRHNCTDHEKRNCDIQSIQFPNAIAIADGPAQQPEEPTFGGLPGQRRPLVFATSD